MRPVSDLDDSMDQSVASKPEGLDLHLCSNDSTMAVAAGLLTMMMSTSCHEAGPLALPVDADLDS